MTLGEDAIGALPTAAAAREGQHAEPSVHEPLLTDVSAEVVQVVDIEMVDLIVLGATD